MKYDNSNLEDKLNTVPSNGSNLDVAIEASLRRILASENLEFERNMMKALASNLCVDQLDCSSALLFYCRNQNNHRLMFNNEPSTFAYQAMHPEIKMVRYRMEVGRKHGVTTEDLCKILIAESGVDKNNINNIDIQSICTYIELPDEMPQDIFLHLKSLRINEQKLDIKRIKNRKGKKKRSRLRHDRQRKSRLFDQGQNAI